MSPYWRWVVTSGVVLGAVVAICRYQCRVLEREARAEAHSALLNDRQPASNIVSFSLFHVRVRPGAQGVEVEEESGNALLQSGVPAYGSIL